MIDIILQLLALDDFKGESEEIDIAKGKYKYPDTIKDAYKQFKREIVWLRKK